METTEATRPGPRGVAVTLQISEPHLDAITEAIRLRRQALLYVARDLDATAKNDAQQQAAVAFRARADLLTECLAEIERQA